MNALLPVLEFIQSILTKPAWIMGLFAFVGLVALKRPAHKVMTGTLKPILGYIMLSAGATVVQENLAPLGTFIETGFHISRASCPTTRSSYPWRRACSASRRC